MRKLCRHAIVIAKLDVELPGVNMKKGEPLSTLLSIQEASRIFDFHGHMLRRWARQGLIKPYRLGPYGEWRFKLTDIDEFLKRHSEGWPSLVGNGGRRLHWVIHSPVV